MNTFSISSVCFDVVHLVAIGVGGVDHRVAIVADEALRARRFGRMRLGLELAIAGVQDRVALAVGQLTLADELEDRRCDVDLPNEQELRLREVGATIFFGGRLEHERHAQHLAVERN